MAFDATSQFDFITKRDLTKSNSKELIAKAVFEEILWNRQNHIKYYIILNNKLCKISILLQYHQKVAR